MAMTPVRLAPRQRIRNAAGTDTQVLLMVSADQQTEYTPDGEGDAQPPVVGSPVLSGPVAAQRLPLLRRTDQAVVALLVAMSLVAVAAYWTLRGGARGELIEIDSDASPTDAPRLISEYAVDLNSADWPEFEPLPGVGERLARRIVDSRAAEGPFQSVDDLTRVAGIGEKTVERLRPFLRVGPTRKSP